MFLDACLRGLGQVCGEITKLNTTPTRTSIRCSCSALSHASQVSFMNSPFCGLFVIAAAIVNSHYYCLMGMLGLVCSTLTAIGMGFNRGIV